MTTKKTTTKGGEPGRAEGRQRAATARGTGPLERRAQAIVDDAGRYDAETREAVRLALDNNADDLAELVMRAEAAKADDLARNRNPLTAEQAACLAEEVAGVEAETVAQTALLCFAFACEPREDTRAIMLGAVQARLSIYLADFDGMVKAEMRRQLEALTKGGA